MQNKTVIHYRHGDYNGWRLWRDHWAGDQFDIMTNEEFVKFKQQAISLGLEFQFHGDDE